MVEIQLKRSARVARAGLATSAQGHGLYRARIAGPRGSLVEAFANLDRSPDVERVIRHPTTDLVCARVALKPDEGEGYWELSRIRNELYVILANFKYKHARFEFVPGDGLVQFNFKLSGDLTYGVRRPGPLRFNRPALHVWRQPKGINMREWTAPASLERMVAIAVSPEFLLNQLLDAGAEVPARLRAFVSEPQSEIDYCELPLTAQMFDVTEKLLGNPHAGPLYLKYQEALTLELMCAAVGTLASSAEQPSAEYTESQLRALSAARELMVHQRTSAPTLREIARAVRLSPKALALGFRAVYGETPYEFSVRHRMQHAMTLLRDRHWSVDRASEAVGYSHPTSFATAFKSHFGLRPIEVKRRRPTT